MTTLPGFQKPDAREAHENLRVIRELMERPTKHSTFSGFAGILAGLASIAGCLITYVLQRQYGPPDHFPMGFLALWSVVTLTAIGGDYLLNKRKAAWVGKHIRSRLGKQVVRAALPGLGVGVVLTLFLLQWGLLNFVYPVWMLAYGLAVCSVGLFSQREVSYLGLAFLAAGTLTLLLFPAWGLPMMALTFGGFHIVYGLLMGPRDGW